MVNKPDLLKTTAADLANGSPADGTPELPDHTLRVKVTGSATRQLELDAQFSVATHRGLGLRAVRNRHHERIKNPH